MRLQFYQNAILKWSGNIQTNKHLKQTNKCLNIQTNRQTIDKEKQEVTTMSTGVLGFLAILLACKIKSGYSRKQEFQEWNLCRLL